MRSLTAIVLCMPPAVVGAVVAWLALSYRALPVSELGVAYVIGAAVALTSEQVDAIAKGATPTIEFRRDSTNRYVWQRGTIERPSGCLYYRADPTTRQLAHPASCPSQDRISRTGNQLHFAAERGGLRIGISDKPAADATRVTDGALYEAEGEISIGTDINHAAWFKIMLDAEWLNLGELPHPTDPDPTSAACQPARATKLRDPAVLGLLPAVAARSCRIEPEQPEQKRALFLVHFQSGPLQWMDWTNQLSCRALLQRLMPSRSAGDLAGCVGGPWGGFDRIDLRLSFFEVTPTGEFAAIR